MRVLSALSAVLLLASCDTPVGNEIMRDRARAVVDTVVEDKAPSVDPRPVTDCIIDNATGSEIITIGAAAVTGVDQFTVDLVLEIATRPDTLTCLVQDAGPLVVAQFASQG